MYYSYEDISADDWEALAVWAQREGDISVEMCEQLKCNKRRRFRAVMKVHENSDTESGEYCLAATYSRKKQMIEVGAFFSVGTFSLASFACLIKSFKLDAQRLEKELRITTSDACLKCHKILKNMHFKSRAIRVSEYVGVDGISSNHEYQFTYVPKVYQG